jgi:hypothetical protein
MSARSLRHPAPSAIHPTIQETVAVMTSEADMPKEAIPSQPVSRLAALARATLLTLGYAATLTALALPVGVGYFSYQRWIGGRSLQETSLHLDDA